MKEKILKKGIKKRLFSVVLALAMVVALLPSMPAFAADTAKLVCTSTEKHLKITQAKNQNGYCTGIMYKSDGSVDNESWSALASKCEGASADGPAVGSWWVYVNDKYIACTHTHTVNNKLVCTSTEKHLQITSAKNSNGYCTGKMYGTNGSVEYESWSALASKCEGASADGPAVGSWWIYANDKYTACGGSHTIVVPHTHTWSYSVENTSKLVATCTCKEGDEGYDDCEYKEIATGADGRKVSLTLTASSANYSGSAYTGASLGDTTAWVSAVGAAPAIAYSQGTTTLSGAPTNAGSYTASITVGENESTKTASASFTISPAPLTITGAMVADKTYDGTTTANVTGVTFSGLQNSETLTKGTDYTVTGAFNSANVADANKVTVTVTLSNSNYSLATATYEVESKTIAKATPTYSAPTAIPNLKYTGSEQEVISAGTATNGTMQYKLGASGTYSTNIPKATDAGTYTVYYKVVGATNYNDISEKQVSVSIGKADATNAMKAASGNLKAKAASTATISFTNLPANATFGTPTGAISGVTAVIESNALKLTVGGSDLAAGTSAFDVTVPVNDSTNYKPYNIKVTVTPTFKLTQTVAATESNVTVTYGDTNKSVSASNTTTAAEGKTPGTISYAVTSGADVVDVNPSTGALTIKKAGTATITATAVENDDYAAATATITVTVGKKAVTVTANNKSAYVGDNAPTLGQVVNVDYTVVGLVGTDTLNTQPTLDYAETPDMTKTGTVTITATGDATAAGDNYTVSYANGTLTISNRPSSGGSSAPTVTVPVSGDEHSVNVSASVSGTTATVNIKDADIEKITHADAETGVVEIDLSGLKQDVNTAKIPTKTVEKIAEAIAEHGNDTEGVSVKLSTATVTFDGTATQAISEQAKGNTIEIKVDEADKKNLTAEQKSAIEGLGSQIIVEATVVSNGQKISDFKGGSAEVSIPYTLKNAQKANGLVVFFVADDGSVEKVPATYVDGNVVFTVKHFSHYVVAYNAANVFTDVAEGDYYYDAVKWAVENGITKGTSATTFSPNGITTRAQVVTFLWRAAGSPEPKAMSSFSDVAAGSYYEKAVAWAVENGITSGVGGNRFAPDANCTRGQIVTFLYRYNGVNTLNIKDNPFTDVAEGQFYYDAVLWAAENGVTSGTSATTFSPASNCLRGQVVTFLYRLLVK